MKNTRYSSIPNPNPTWKAQQDEIEALRKQVAALAPSGPDGAEDGFTHIQKLQWHAEAVEQEEGGRMCKAPGSGCAVS